MTNCMQFHLVTAAALCIAQADGQEISTPAPTPPPSAELPDLATERTVHYRNAALITGGALLIGWYGKTNWWKDGFTGDFRTEKEGWFGQHTYAGGADKLGHFYMNYAASRLAVYAFTWAGNDRRHAVVLGALATFGTMMAVEAIDGYSRRWRFSTEDAVMNALGAGTAVILENNPGLDRLLDFRMHYRASANNGRNFDPFGDYSGQTYVVALKAAGIPALREHPWLRYVELVAGYGARNFPENGPNAGNDLRSRNVYLGISLNLSELLGQKVFKGGPPSRVRRVTETALEFVQVPGTAAVGRRTLPRD